MDFLKRIAGKPIGLASSALQGAADLPQNIYGLGRAGIKALTGYEIGPEQLSLPKGSPLGGLINIARGRNPYEQVGIPGGRELKENIIDPLAERTIGKKNLEPQSWPEEIAHMTARNALPLYATGGLSSIPKAAASIGRDLAGSTGIKSAESAGFGALGQVIAGIGSSIGFNKFLNRLSKNPLPPQTLNNIAQQEKTKFYNRQKELGSNVKLPVNEIENKITEIEKNIRKDISLKSVDRNDLLHAVEELKGDVSKGKITGAVVVDRRQQLNDVIANRTTDPKARYYYRALRQPVKDTIKDNRGNYPSWDKALQGADSIHNAQHFPEYFAQKFEDLPKIAKALKNPWAAGAASLGPALFFTTNPLSLLGTSAATASAIGAGRKGLEIIGFARQAEPQKILMKASSELLSNNIPAALASYHKLDKLADKYQKEEGSFNKRREEKYNKSTEGLVRRNQKEMTMLPTQQTQKNGKSCMNKCQ